MGAVVIDIGQSAHEDERAALKFLADGLPPTATVFTNPWLVEPSGAVYELDAVVVMPHAIYIVEIKGWSGAIRGELRDWYLPRRGAGIETRRSPLQLAHKTAQILRSLLARQSHEAGRAWVQELVFLPNASSFGSESDGVRKRVALRSEIHAVLNDVARVSELSNRRTSTGLGHEVHDTLTRMLRGGPMRRSLTHVAGFTVIDRFDANERYQEVLGKDFTDTHRVLRIYRIAQGASDAERDQLRKRATWEAGVLRSFARAPDDVCLPQVDPPVETDDGLVVPIEHFDGQTLPAWLAGPGKELDLRARVALWVRIARALAWTHKAGVVHRHLRPDLVLVKGDADPRDPRTPEYRVTGFDLAKRQNHQTTIAFSDATLARLEGAAPEVVTSPSDALPASDQFSLGLVLALLVLRKPLLESTLPLVERRHRIPHLRDVNPDVPQRLDDAVARMLERKPGDRFPSLEDAIAHVLSAIHTGASEPVAGLAPGARVGTDYVVEGRLGEGGLADVYQVKHQLLGERFALKVARPTEVAERAIRCEFYALASIAHPSIVRAHDLTKMVEDRITLRLDLVPGANLSETVRQGKLPAGDLAARRRLGEDLLSALDELERVELQHNDLKPDNLMVTQTGRLVLIDFSLARGPAVAAKMGDAPTFGGTCDWRDPSGEPPGPVTDRYAAAMCLFWLHTGRHPFDGRVPEPDDRPDLDRAEIEPESLVLFFAKALDPVPAERFRSARAMRDAYLTALGAPVGDDAEGPLVAATPLVETKLPQRVVRALAAAQVRTVGELVALGDDDLAQIPGLGDRLLGRARALVADARRQGVDVGERAAPDAPPIVRSLAFDPGPIRDLPLDVSVIEALYAAGIRTIGAAASRTRDELLRVPRIRAAQLQRLVEALVKWEGRVRATDLRETLDALWERATRSLDDAHVTILERVFGLRGPPQIQGQVAADLGLDQPTVSIRKNAALDRLDRDALAPVVGALDGYLELERGILPLEDACRLLVRDLPTGNVEPSGLVRLLACVDTRTFALLEGVTDHDVSLLARPWVKRELLETFADAVSGIVSKWPPEPLSATEQTLRMALPEFQGDLALLARRLVPSVLATPAGALFQPPVRLEDGLEYVLGLLRRDEVTHADLAAELERVFAGVGPALPPLHELPALLEHLPWRVDGASIVRRHAAGVSTPAEKGDDPRAVLAVDATVDPIDRVKLVLQDTAKRGGFRLVVAPPEKHRAIARSLVDQLGAVSVDLTDAWFRRNEGTLASDARGARFPALKAAASKRLDQLVTELVREHGAPGRTVVVHEAGILGVLGGLDQIRLLYDRVLGQSVGFWILVIPGLVRDRQPLFNERQPVWHHPGYVLPLGEPLR